jgi:chromate reductase, NAD(P)H dehydrogenase (quinone)
VTRILAISGSLRRLSHNTGLLRAAAEQAPEGTTIELYEDLESLPPFNEDRESDPGPVVEEMRRRVREADALLFSTPEYNTTMPGQLKHLVDWGSRPYGPEAALYGKPAAVIGASKTDYGALWAQDHLRKALGLAGARVTEVELPVGKAHEKFDESGKLIDPETIQQLEQAVSALVAHHGSLAVAQA